MTTPDPATPPAQAKDDEQAKAQTSPGAGAATTATSGDVGQASAPAETEPQGGQQPQPAATAKPADAAGSAEPRVTLQNQQPERTHLPRRNLAGMVMSSAVRVDAANNLSALNIGAYTPGQRATDPLKASAAAAPAAATAAAPPPSSTTWRPAPLPDGADEATRKAYEVAAREMAAGENVAKELASTAAAARTQDVPVLLNRLLSTYSDLGSVFVQLVGAAIEQGKGLAALTPAASQPAAAAAPAAGQAAPTASHGAVAVRIKSAEGGEYSASALSYGALTEAPVASPLTRIGGGAVLPAPTMKPGPTVLVEVPKGAAPGDYYGVILSKEEGAPAGTITLTIAAS